MTGEHPPGVWKPRHLSNEMVFDTRRLAAFIEGHADPGPFSGVIQVSLGKEVLFKRAYGLAIRSESLLNGLLPGFR